MPHSSSSAVNVFGVRSEVHNKEQNFIRKEGKHLIKSREQVTFNIIKTSRIEREREGAKTEQVLTCSLAVKKARAPHSRPTAAPRP